MITASDFYSSEENEAEVAKSSRKKNDDFSGFQRGSNLISEAMNFLEKKSQVVSATRESEVSLGLSRQGLIK